MSHAGALEATREEIALVCSYMNDNAVAKYFGIEERRVKHIRSTMHDSADDRRITSSRAVGRDTSSGEVIQKLFIEDAEAGSKDLRKALYRATHGFAVRYGISVEEARHLLLNTGVRVPA